MAAISAGTAAVVAAGPVAGILVSAYAALAMRAVARRRADRASAHARSRMLDALCALAADLRAGLPPAAAWPAAVWPAGNAPRGSEGAGVAGRSPTVVPGAVAPGLPTGSLGAGPTVGGTPGGDAVWAADERVARLLGAVWRLAEQSGAPLAALIERVEADARAADRARTTAASQAAGARATAALLAGLPAGGIALGYAIGTDPLHVLLHTPLGAGCALGALALQFAGLAWADRLAGPRATVS